MCNILETCPPKSLSISNAEGITTRKSAGLRRPRFSFFLFNCQTTDSGSAGIGLHATLAQYTERPGLTAFRKCTCVRFPRITREQTTTPPAAFRPRCGGVYSLRPLRVSTRIGDIFELFLKKFQCRDSSVQ